MGLLMEGTPAPFHEADCKHLVISGVLRSHSQEESFQPCSTFGSTVSLVSGKELRT